MTNSRLSRRWRRIAALGATVLAGLATMATSESSCPWGVGSTHSSASGIILSQEQPEQIHRLQVYLDTSKPPNDKVEILVFMSIHVELTFEPPAVGQYGEPTVLLRTSGVVDEQGHVYDERTVELEDGQASVTLSTGILFAKPPLPVHIPVTLYMARTDDPAAGRVLVDWSAGAHLGGSEKGCKQPDWVDFRIKVFQ